MVRFRGVEVSLTSQFDLRKLPEFGIPTPLYTQRSKSPSFTDIGLDAFTEPTKAPACSKRTLQSVASNAIASCFVPVCPGSQVRLEYAIQPPHPPNASYFFKMLHNERTVTSWDCTSKHGYRGKVSHVFATDDDGVGRRMVLQFSNAITDRHIKPNLWPGNDCLEIRVHRIEARKGLNIEEMIAGLRLLPTNSGCCEGRLRLVQGGALEANQRKRCYRYQLLDAVDEPYATFRFYYRTYGFLEAHLLTWPSSSHGRASSVTPDRWNESPESPTPAIGEKKYCNYSPLSVKTRDYTNHCGTHRRSAGRGESLGSPENVGNSGHTLPERGPDGSSLTYAKDSIEDLPSDVPRSPKKSKTKSCLLDGIRIISPSRTRSSYKSSTREITKAEFNI